MQVIIDRFEGNFAVVETENGDMVNVPSVLVKGAKEGDVVTIEVDKTATKKRRESIEKKKSALFED